MRYARAPHPTPRRKARGTPIPPASPGARSASVPAAALVAAGAGLRIAQWLSDRSLWGDEARLALNLLERSAARLLEPLDYDQAAAVGFLLVERLLLETFGAGERALRALPLLAGLAALPLFWRVAQRVLPRPEALFALALFAFSEPLVFYSAELKPYAVDVCATLAVLAVALPQVDRAPRAGPLLALAAVGAAALAFSLAAVFACAAAAAGLALAHARRARSPRAAGPALAVGLAWAGLVAAGWLAFADGGTWTYMRAYWKSGFAPLPTGLEELSWYPATAIGYFEDPAGLELPGVAFLLTLAGVASLARARPERARAAALLVAPCALVALASLCSLYPISSASPERYPWGGRLVLFTVPACFALVAEGAGRLTRSTDALPRALGLAAGALLLLPAAAGAIWRLFDPPRIQELRDVVAFVDEHLEPGDAVWVHREGVPAFRYYARRRGLPADLAIEPIVPGAPWPAFEERIEALPARSRVWTVFVSHELWGERNDERYIGRLLEKRGRFVGSIERPGASAHLFLTPPLP